MTAESPAATGVARELWSAASAAASSPEEIAAAADRMLFQLRTGLGRWIGADGYRALFDRSLELAQAEQPALSVLARRDGDAVLTAAAVRAQGPEELATGLMRLTAQIIELLGRIVGEEMAIRLVEHTAMEAPQGNTGTERKAGRNG